MIKKTGTLPKSEIVSKRSPEERNILRLLGRVRRNLAKSTNANISTWWEMQIGVLEKQLVKATARA